MGTQKSFSVAGLVKRVFFHCGDENRTKRNCSNDLRWSFQLVDLCMMDRRSLQFPYGVIAAAAVYSLIAPYQQKLALEVSGQIIAPLFSPAFRCQIIVPPPGRRRRRQSGGGTMCFTHILGFFPFFVPPAGRRRRRHLKRGW